MTKTQFLTLLTVVNIAVCIVNCSSGPKLKLPPPPAPQIVLYVSDPELGGMEYYDPEKDEKGFVAYSQTDRFVAMSSEDAQRIFNYCQVGK